MKHENLDLITTSLSAFLTTIQADQLFQLLGFIVTIISALIGVAYRIYHWYKEAKADGKIDSDEIKKLIDLGKISLDEIKDIIDQKGDKDNDHE